VILLRRIKLVLERGKMKTALAPHKWFGSVSSTYFLQYVSAHEFNKWHSKTYFFYLHLNYFINYFRLHVPLHFQSLSRYRYPETTRFSGENAYFRRSFPAALSRQRYPVTTRFSGENDYFRLPFPAALSRLRYPVTTWISGENAYFRL
jgi:hypothetical protein